MTQPEDFTNSQFPSYVCKLRKSLYGLKQAPRAWYTKLRQALHGWGFARSVSDASLFINQTAKAVLFLLVYVDDILVTGSDSSALKECIHDLDTYFALKTLGSINYFLGFEVFRNETRLYLTQSKYTLDLLHKAGLQIANHVRPHWFWEPPLLMKVLISWIPLSIEP